MSYKILWYSIPALHDNTNGAAIHNKILLEALAARGMQVKVLNALVADDVSGLEIFKTFAKMLNDKAENPLLRFTDNKVEYFVAKTKGHLSQEVTNADQGRIFDFFIQLLEQFQPDVVMGYSGDIFSAYLRHEAQVRGIPVVYALCNGLHRSFGFADCDLVFAPSEATAKMYQEGDNIPVKAVGQFIDRQRIMATKRDEAHKDEIKYVTLVNPTPEKGLAIFVKLHEIFAEKHPEIPFLVVKSVGNYEQCMLRLHNADGTPYLKQNESTRENALAAQIKVAEHTNDMRLVYDITRAVVMPSVWHESWGCVATEAVFNGIPVLASKSGGLPEAVREGGILLDAPECTQRDFCCVPSNEEIAPWVEALERCLFEDWTEPCRKASEYNSLDHSVDRLMEYLEPIMKKGQETKRPLDKSYFFSERFMQRHKTAIEARQAAQAQAQVQTQAQGAVPQQPAGQPQQQSAVPAHNNKGSKKKKK